MVVRPDFYVYGGVSEIAALSGLVTALMADIDLSSALELQ